MWTAQYKKASVKATILYQPTYITFQKQNYGYRKNTNGCQGLSGRKKNGEEKEEAMNRQSTGYFQGSGAILYDTIMVDTHHCVFVKTPRTDKGKNES